MLLVRPLGSSLLSWRVTEGRSRLLAPAGADVGGQVPVLVEVGVEGQRSKLVIGNQVASVVGHLWVSHVWVSKKPHGSIVNQQTHLGNPNMRNP